MYNILAMIIDYIVFTSSSYKHLINDAKRNYFSKTLIHQNRDEKGRQNLRNWSEVE